jgi:ATP-binding cassette, subfamily B, bacterial MsbA
MCCYMVALTRPVKKLSEVNSVIAKGIAAANSVFEMLELPVEQNTPTHTKIVPILLMLLIEMRNVKLRYKLIFL